MAAPNTTIWGSPVTHTSKGWEAKLGINVAVTNNSDNKTCAVTIDVWFWSEYSVDDGSNKFYFDNESSTAATEKGSVDINTTSNTAWSTSNQVKIKTFTYSSVSRTTSDLVKYCSAKLTGVEAVSGKTMTVSTSYTIPKVVSYAVTYNANGGSGAPSAQTKYYNTDLTLSSTVPSRTGYTFLGWSTSSTATSATYSKGGTLPANANQNTTLYAVWQANTYTVTFNANGGKFSSGDTVTTVTTRTKTHDQPLTIIAAAAAPTRSNYTLKGWGTSASSTTVAYSAWEQYTVNAPITLYAIWELAYKKPEIKNLSITRSDVNGEYTDEGTYFRITFDWKTESEVQDVLISWLIDEPYTHSVEVSGTSGSVAVTLGEGLLDVDSTYNITVSVRDTTKTYTQITKTVPARTFTIDFLKGGKGIAIGKPAESPDTLDVNWIINARDAIFTPLMIATKLYEKPDSVSRQIAAVVEKVLLNSSSTLSVANNTSAAMKTWTVDEPGLYAMSATAYWSANATGMRALFIRVDNSNNDVAYARQYSGGNANFTQNVSGYARLTKGQVVYVYAWQNSGAALTLNDYLVQIIKIGA